MPVTCWIAIFSTFSAGEHSVLTKISHLVAFLSCLIVPTAALLVSDSATKACEFIISLFSRYVFYAWGYITAISLVLWAFSAIKYIRDKVK